MSLLEATDPEEVAVLSSIVSSQLLGIHDSEGFFRKPGRTGRTNADLMSLRQNCTLEVLTLDKICM